MRSRYSLGLVAVLALASVASANFTPPANIAPFLPAQNPVVVTARVSVVANVDQYDVSYPGTVLPATILSVTAGTSAAKVQGLAASNLAFNRFKAATLTPGDQVNPFQLQLAGAWFMNNIGRPYYGL